MIQQAIVETPCFVFFSGVSRASPIQVSTLWYSVCSDCMMALFLSLTSLIDYGTSTTCWAKHWSKYMYIVYIAVQAINRESRHAGKGHLSECTDSHHPVKSMTNGLSGSALDNCICRHS